MLVSLLLGIVVVLFDVEFARFVYVTLGNQ